MKSRNREINIFNMSLLDVLCGALGAFCFMMLVLFPYYKPKQESAPPPGPPKNCEDCMQQHEKIQQQLNDTQARNAQLGMRNPFAIEMIPRQSDFNIDLYIEDDRVGADGKPTAKPDAKKVQNVTFEGDIYWPGTGAYPEVWMIRDVPRGSYRVYYKVMAAIGDPPTFPVLVEGRFLNGSAPALLPKVVVRKVGEILHVATVTSDGEGKFAFKAEMPDADLDKLIQERNQLIQQEQSKSTQKKEEPKKP